MSLGYNTSDSLLRPTFQVFVHWLIVLNETEGLYCGAVLNSDISNPEFYTNVKCVLHECNVVVLIWVFMHIS